MGRHIKDTFEYDEDEARICLNCTMKSCPGKCEHLAQEKKRIKAEQKTESSEEFTIPDEPPWPKKNPYIKEAHAHDKGAAAKLPKN